MSLQLDERRWWEREVAYSPDQARDETGKWTSEGGGDTGATSETSGPAGPRDVRQGGDPEAHLRAKLVDSGASEVEANAIVSALRTDRDGPANRPDDAGQKIPQATSGADFESRYLPTVEQTPEFREAKARLDALEAQTESGDVRMWSKEMYASPTGKVGPDGKPEWKYNEDRQALHEEHIAKMLPESSIAPEGTRPALVMLTGPPGAGKSQSGVPYANQIAPNLGNVNADYVKEHSPEYRGWNAASLHEESSDVVEKMALPQAIKDRNNVIFDATGANTKKMTDLAREFGPTHDVHVINVGIPSYQSASRAWERFQKNAFEWQHGSEKAPGRFVPPKYAYDMGDSPTVTYESLKDMPEVKTWTRLDTSAPGNQPARVVDSGSREGYGRKGKTNASRSRQALPGDGRRHPRQGGERGSEGARGASAGGAEEARRGKERGRAELAAAFEPQATRWWEREVAWQVDSGFPWWERAVAYSEDQPRDESGKWTDTGGGAGPPTEQKITERQVKADQGWKRAQDLKPVEQQQYDVRQQELPGTGESSDFQAEVWSDPDRLDKWADYDEAMNRATDELGIPRGAYGNPEQHPNESPDEFHERELRDQWRTYNDEIPDDAEEMGAPSDWDTHESDYGNVYQDQDKLDRWKDYDDQFTEGKQEEGEADEAFKDREQREGYRQQNADAEEADNEAQAQADAEAEEEARSAELDIPSHVSESADELGDLLGFNDLASHDTAVETKQNVQKNVGGAIAKDESVTVEQLRNFNQSTFSRGMQSTSADATTERQVESEVAANSLVALWAATSGDHDSGAIAVQKVAQKVFGLDEATTDHLGYGESSSQLATTHEAVISAALQGMYDDTQEKLKDAPDKVWLYRGVKEHYDDGDTVKLQPLSSFSTNPQTSQSFAGSDGTVFAVEVPKDRILSTARTGAGCLSEQEVIVLGGEYEVERVSSY